MSEHIPRKYFQETKHGRIFFLPVAGHPAVIGDFGIQPVFLGHSVAELVCTRVRSRRQLSLTKEKAGRAHPPVRYGKVWIEFDSPLIESKRSLSIAGEVEFVALTAGLQSLGRRAERLFQWLIEARQRICGLSQLRAKACGDDSQLVYDLIPLSDVHLLFGQGCSRSAVERPHLQMVAIAGIADRLGDHHLAV